MVIYSRVPRLNLSAFSLRLVVSFGCILYHTERRIRPHEVRTVLPSYKAETASASAHSRKVDRHTGRLNVVTEG